MTTQSISWGRTASLAVPAAALIIGFFLLSGSQVAAEAREPRQAPVMASPEPVAPDHYWQFKQGNQYGYTDDSGSGIVNFVLYEGITANGRYILKHYTANGFAEMTCAAPCDLVLVREVHIYSINYNSQSADTVNPQRGTVLWAMIQDLMNGKLEN